MARKPSENGKFVQEVLVKHGGAISYRYFLSTPEYVQHIQNGGSEITGGFFSQNKFRFNNSPAAAAASVAAAAHPFVAPVAAKAKAALSGMTWDNPGQTYNSEMQLMIPEVDSNFVVTEQNKAVVILAQQQISSGFGTNVKLVGPAGCGKTSFAVNFAANRRVPALVLNCATVREPRDWFGSKIIDANTKAIVWRDSMFVKMLETPYSVIVLDEINRVSPMVLNSLLGLLDHQRKVYLEEAGRMINLAEGVSFWGAMNEGSTFTGTLPMDKALKDRFRLVVECAFLDAATEVDVLNAKTGLDTDNCRRLVEVANQVRLKAMSDNLDSFSDAISTRMLESAAQGLVLGGTKTLNYTLLNHYSAGGPTGQSERDNLRKLLVGKFGSI